MLCVCAAAAWAVAGSLTAACVLQDEGGPLHGEAAGRHVGHELLMRLGSTGDIAAAACASVRAVAAPGPDGSAGAAAAPLYAVGCVAVADGGEVVGHVDDKLVARDFQGEKICEMVEVRSLGRVLRCDVRYAVCCGSSTWLTLSLYACCAASLGDRSWTCTVWWGETCA